MMSKRQVTVLLLQVLLQFSPGSGAQPAPQGKGQLPFGSRTREGAVMGIGGALSQLTRQWSLSIYSAEVHCHARQQVS